VYVQSQRRWGCCTEESRFLVCGATQQAQTVTLHPSTGPAARLKVNRRDHHHGFGRSREPNARDRRTARVSGIAGGEGWLLLALFFCDLLRFYPYDQTFCTGVHRATGAEAGLCAHIQHYTQATIGSASSRAKAELRALQAPHTSTTTTQHNTTQHNTTQPPTMSSQPLLQSAPGTSSLPSRRVQRGLPLTNHPAS
jgi:hypothetical protein